MTIKPFAIQGADLTLGGVNLQAGATTIVIPGVTQAANYFVEEVDEYGSDDNQDLGSQEGAITIIDNAEYVYRSGGAQPSGAYVPAEYSVDELDDGNIEEVQVEVDGTFAAADKTRAEASNMWATLTPTPFVSFNADNWGQIPFRPKMRAGEVTNVGGGGGSLTVGNGTNTSVENVTEILINGTITEIEPGLVGITISGGGTSSDPNIWVQTFVSDAPTEDFPQIATSVEYDSDGNVIALFSHLQTGGIGPDSRYFSVGKYTDTGTKIWTARFADDLETDGWGLAVDNADGWIYVAGQTGGDVYTYDVSTLTKIDSLDGSVAWSKIYDFGFASSSAVVDVDSTGNPVMVGYANNGTDSYLTVTKIDKTNGNVTWTRKLDGQTNEQAYGMAVGPAGEIVAVGSVDNLNYPEPYRTIVTLTATPASDPDWTTDILGATQGGLTYDVTFAGGVPTFSNIVDTDGNRYEGDLLVTFNASQLGSGSTNMEVRVGTTTGEDMSDRMVVVKYAANGTIAWQKAIQFDADYDCSGADADIDSNGNIYICGQFDIEGGDIGIALVKFDSTGVKQWSRRVTGDCVSTATSIVVGPDDKLYISGVNGDDVTSTFTWVVAKYSLDGLVEWQRFIENTDSWTFAGSFFGPESGGSNIAVRQGYVALAGGFGSFDQQAYAAVLQISDTGNVFAVGPWSVTAANLSGTLNGTASDIGVVNADLTDSDNALTVEPDSVTIGTEVSAFLIGTLYTAPGGNNSLVNGLYSVTLGNTGTVTLPAGGTITEGYVTSNPTIQLTPASPDVASQKLVIKGGGMFDYTDNGINLNYNDNIAQVGDTLTFFVNSTTYADQTLYWWITPAGVGIGDSESGTVVLTGSGGQFTILVDSDDYEFRIRVSPEADNYDPASLGVESGLINPDAPTFDADHHLHLTTGNLAETSIFLGTDNHNVRTTVNGGIEITTPNTTDNVWRFGTDGTTTFPTLTVERGDDPSNTITGQTLLFGDSTQEAIISTPNGTVANNSSQRLVINPGEGYNGGEGGDIYLWAGRGGDASGTGGDIKIRGGQGGANTDGGAGGDGGYIRIEAGDAASTGGDAGYVDIHGGLSTTSGGAVNIRTATTNTFNHAWQFGNNGMLTLPKASKVSEVTPATGPAPSIYPTPGESSIANEAFVTVPPPAVNNYTIPGTDIVINMTFGANGPSFYGPTATIVNGGTGHTTGESLMIPYADMGITYGGNWEWFVNAIASNLVLEAGTKDWTFAADGTTTFPGAITRVVVGTVAKTGVVLPTTTGVVDGLTSNSALAGLTDGTYGPFTLTGVTLSVVVFGGVINGFSNVSGTATVNDVLGTVDSGDVGGTAGTTITITVSTVVQATPTALDLTKSVNKLTTGYYTLADGVEGQVMHLVRQTSTNNATVIVANARVAGDQYTALEHYPFTAGDIGMLIFTDGAWQSMSGTWD